MYPKLQTFFVLGLSRSGRSAALFLLEKGAEVYVYDDLKSLTVENAKEELTGKGAKWVEKNMLDQMSKVCDALVLSPGIPIDHPIGIAFKRARKAIVGEAELATHYLNFPVVAVTGTNGKTTTVSLIEKVINDSGRKAKACGNIGTPLIDVVGEKIDFAVAEISSFQLETLSSMRAHIAVVLNITEDHLNRHYNMENYIFLKAKLVKNLTETEYAVLNYDDETVRKFAGATKGRTVWFSRKNKVNGAYVDGEEICFAGEKIMTVSDIPLKGEHNLMNVLAAVAVGRLIGIDGERIRRSVMSFQGIAHRIQFVGEADGIRYVNDSKGTNVDAAKKAVDAIASETVLMLGGADKGYDYKSLFEYLKTTKTTECVLYGENRFKLLQDALRVEYKNVSVCKNMTLAFEVASRMAKAGQTVLLSPASASFDEFSNYEERGERFVALVRETQKSSKNKERQGRETSTGVCADGDGLESRKELFADTDGEDGEV